MAVPTPDGGDPWILSLATALVTGGFAVAGGTLKYLLNQVAVLNRRLDESNVKIDDTNTETENLVDRRHRDNLMAIESLRSTIDEDRKAEYNFRLSMSERIGTLATQADLRHQTDRLISMLQQQRHHAWAGAPGAAFSPDVAD